MRLAEARELVNYWQEKLAGEDDGDEVEEITPDTESRCAQRV